MLERVQQLKQEYGIGSKQAFEYVSAIQKYDALLTKVQTSQIKLQTSMDQLNSLMGIRKQKKNSTPSVDELINVCDTFRLVFRGLDVRDVADSPKKDFTHTFAILQSCYSGTPAYHVLDTPALDSFLTEQMHKACAADPAQRNKLINITKNLYELVVYNYFIEERRQPVTEEKQLRGVAKAITTSFDVNPRSLHRRLRNLDSLRAIDSLSLKDTLYGMHGHLIELEGIPGDRLSCYARGVLEQTLHSVDTERRIALQYIRSTTDTTLPKDVRISNALKELGKELRLSRVPTFDLMDGDASEPDFDEGVAFCAGRKKADELESFKPVPVVKRSAESIYPLLRGTATRQEARDYRANEATYTTRAILENANWLKKILS